jgi:diacylglycerol kinase (ATP)
MKVVKLLYNPGAGNGAFNKKRLIRLLEENGFDCRYFSPIRKENWKLKDDIDFLVVAGGDGTIRKTVKGLLGRNILEKTLPIGLLPMGTANNIAKTLNITGEPEEIIYSWRNGYIKKFDVGRVSHIYDVNFFMESFGYGIFPYLMLKMIEHGKEKIEQPEEKLKASLELLHTISQDYMPRYCKLEADGVDHSGKFLLAELMNIRSIGPNLLLAPMADPGDGELDMALVPEQDKEKFITYIADRINGKDVAYDYSRIKAKQIKISWNGTHVHVDDKIVKIKKGSEVDIELKEKLISFLMPFKA